MVDLLFDWLGLDHACKTLIQHMQSSLILTTQTGGQPFSDTSSYEVSECSLVCSRHGIYNNFSKIGPENAH